jgi:2-oxoglutarate ferredoxin oxidoreductase subunit alpha
MYAGVVAALIDLDLDVMRAQLNESYASKKALLDSNVKALEIGYNYAKEHFTCPLALRTERMNKTAGHIMIEGNAAAGLGCLFAGATVGAWYPITPSTSLMDAFKSFCEKWRVDPETKENNFVIVQAEDELAAIGVVIGASWNGARSFTPTSGPGISLMNEFIGLAYYAEIPAVIFDVQRVGPSTGMPTRTQQGDLMLAAYASHGDTKHVLLFPANPEECFYMAVQAFDLSERLQTPVMVLLDLDIGMNDWLCKELKWDDSYKPDRGKVLSREQLEKIEKFQRYVDKDGDGIPYRTIAGVHPKGAYFTRGSGHNQFGGYTEDSAEYQVVLDRLRRKFSTAKSMVPAAVITGRGDNKMGFVSIGSCDGAVNEAIDILKRRGVHVDYLRVRGFPFGNEVEEFLAKHETIFVIEQNRDAQLRSLLTLETAVEKAKLRSILHYSGMPMSSDSVVDAMLKILQEINPQAATA